MTILNDLDEVINNLEKENFRKESEQLHKLFIHLAQEIEITEEEPLTEEQQFIEDIKNDIINNLDIAKNTETHWQTSAQHIEKAMDLINQYSHLLSDNDRYILHKRALLALNKT